MRVGIREQLALLVLFCCLISLAVMSIATWETSYSYTTGISASNLQLSAYLYSQQLSNDVFFLSSTIQAISTRVLIQNALLRYTQGNNTDKNWQNSKLDLAAALTIGGGTSDLFQARVVANNATGLGGPYGLLNVTANAIPQIPLPARHANGTQVYLGDPDQGFPENLYPKLEYGTRPFNSSYDQPIASFHGVQVNSSHPLFLGPWLLNTTFGLCSITLPVVNNTDPAQVLGWETVVFSARPFFNIARSSQGIGDTGVVLIISPNTFNNLYPPHILQDDPPAAANAAQQRMHFVVPPYVNNSRSTRHANAGYPTPANFMLEQFPAALQVVTRANAGMNNGGSFLDTTNEEGERVSVGFALLPSPLVDWAILVEQSYDEVAAPVVRLRNVIIACLFGTLGFVMIFSIPVAHYFVRPIHRLRVATLKSVDPYAYPSEESDEGLYSERSSTSSSPRPDIEASDELPEVMDEKLGIVQRIMRRLPGRLGQPRRRKSPRQGFRIPGKVPDRKHIVQDELTDLTRTFNAMVDELIGQYERLEEKVAERTAELESAKIAAEAANESKTLFIANISHELKTPLNGILGMTAVCMSEDDPTKLKRSLGIIYKSGDLLLNLLTDLLTFSKNQIGQQLNLDEKEFKLAEIASQILSLFAKQAKEASIKLAIEFQGPNTSLETSSGTPGQTGFGPFGTGRVKDMFLWGDQHRILQVVINLVSNSLKFTPAGGKVTVRIRCAGECDEERPPSSRVSRKGSQNSRQTKSSRGPNSKSRPTSKLRSRNSSGSESSITSGEPSASRGGEVNSRDAKSLPLIHKRERSVSPPPLNARMLLFEFEVEDTGPGIPTAQQQKVFEPFVQGDLGLTKKYGGTGLGLSICSQLASLMRGSIGLNSVEGEGSTFTMRIPLRYTKERADSTASSSLRDSARNSLTQFELHTPRRSGSDSNLSTHSAPPAPVIAPFESAASQPRLVGLSQPFFAANPALESPTDQMEAIEKVAAEAQARGGKIRVLVAEDNKVNQEVVLRMLKLEEVYDVTVAKDGQEALDLVKESMERQERYDLIFMDIQMPNLDGLQSTRLIRQMGFSAPIVALTAFAEESNVQECMDSGMNYFLPKPIRRPQLKQVLKRYCPTIPEAVEESESPPISKKNSMISAEQVASSATSQRPPSERPEKINEIAEHRELSPMEPIKTL